MALANTAGLLAKWGQRILIIDWDLEAPGIEKYFEAWLSDSRKKTPGLVDLINSFADQAPMNWRNCLLRARIPQGETLAILHAGRDSDEYTAQLRRIDWESLFESQKFGLFLETLRTEWITEYDFVFVDSRTGFTDIGGICTIHLPDVLVGLFTASDQSLIGIKDVFQKAARAHSQLPVDRNRLLIVPIPARDESNTEYELSGQWRRRFASELAEFYSGWLPKDETVERILDHLKIPYFPYWSFGERLPVLEEDPENPKTLAFAYQLIARLILGNLDWEEVKRGTRAVEAETAQKLAIEEMGVIAAKTRLEAQREAAERERIARQAEMEALQQRREAFLGALWKPALKKHRRRGAWSLAGIWASGVYLIAMAFGLANLSSTEKQETQLVVSILVFCVLLGWGVYASIRSRRRNRWIVKQLENERLQYEAGIGRYNDLLPENAFAEFVNRVQTTLILQKPEPLPERASSRRSTQPTNQGDSSTSAAKVGVPVDVFLSYEHSALTSGWLREFLPLFVSWLKEGIGREPNVFDPERLLEFQALPPETLQALNSTRCFLPILTPSYFHSEFCLVELRKFIELQGPILPIILHPIVWPSEFQDMVKIQSADFSEFVFIGEGFTKTEHYIEFQKKLRSFAQDVTKIITHSPATATSMSRDQTL
jgi:hypothetical protein